MNFISRIGKTKTFWTAIAAICTAVGMGFAGEVSWGEVIQTGGLALMALFVRDGVEKARKGE